jgi:16S rRNA (cytosine1402-N4)-methyltransferase
MTNASGVYHEPVMLGEVLESLVVHPGNRYIDCTLGDGGHAAAISEASMPGGRLLGMDADPEAITASRDRLERYGDVVTLVHANFATLGQIAREQGFVPAHGVLLDLGLSSRQLDAEERGFSFQRNGPLDMRFNPAEGVPAATLVNERSEEDLANLIYQLGQEPRSRRIARAIVINRPVATAQQLAEIVRRASGYRRGRTHPATRTFQALRMAVNQELANLETVLLQVTGVLAHGGRLVTIAYHSLEDRLVKRFLASDEELRPVHKRVLKPTPEEVSRNRRSRSARIRVAERM